MTIDTKTNEVKHLKPKKVKMEKETLFEQLQDYKVQLNTYKEENTKLKTQLKQLQKDQQNSEAIAEEIMSSHNAPAVGRLNKTILKPKGRYMLLNQIDSFLILGLKKHIGELKTVLRDRDIEIENLK